MKRFALAAALVAAGWGTAASAADKHCYSASDIEAEQAILYQTNLMVVSSACQDTSYATFRLHNKDAIIAYQNAMIAHFRRSGSRRPDKEFETWITSLANQASRKQNGVPTATVCQQAADLMKTASTLDAKAFHQYATAEATKVSARYQKCGK